MISLNRKLTLAAVRTIALSIGLVTFSANAFVIPVSAKRISFDLPHYNKLLEGSGPATNDKSLQAKNDNGQNQSLAPLSLNGPSEEIGPDGAPLLKTTVSKSEYVSKDQNALAAEGGKSIKSISVVSYKSGELGGKVLKDAKSVNIMPLALIETEEEAEKKAETTADSERVQLSSLWEATISRSPDIQFVINRLQPNSDPNHAASAAMKMLSNVLFGAMSAAPLMIPNASAMTYMGANSITSTIGGILGTRDAKKAKKVQVSEEQQTMLYKIVRDTADHLVEKYRNYKKYIASFGRKTTDLQDLQSMVAESRQTQSAAQQIEMEYTLRKQQRDIDEASEEVRQFRQSLIDLAGPDAVANLDKQLNDEQIALQKIAPENELAAPEQQNVFNLPKQRTASQLNMQYQ